MGRPTVGSLFSGIGGLDLGLERAGFEVVWQCEADPFCREVLARHWPGVPCYESVESIGAGTPPVDLVCGGFPCQPVSVAGARRGQDDERWLWPEMDRVIRVLRPRIVLVENVPGLLVRAMGDVLGALAASGYNAEWDCIPAAAVGAPHLRYRVFIVAHDRDALADPEGGGRNGGTRTRAGWDASVRDETRGVFGDRGAFLADTARIRFQGDDHGGGGVEHDRAAQSDRGGAMRAGGPVADPGSARHREDETVRARGDTVVTGGETLADPEGLSEWSGLREDGPGGFGGGRPGDGRSAVHTWATESDVGRVVNGVPRRMDRLKALGNAVVPQVAELIGRRILEGSAT